MSLIILYVSIRTVLSRQQEASLSFAGPDIIRRKLIGTVILNAVDSRWEHGWLSSYDPRV